MTMTTQTSSSSSIAATASTSLKKTAPVRRVFTPLFVTATSSPPVADSRHAYSGMKTPKSAAIANEYRTPDGDEASSSSSSSASSSVSAAAAAAAILSTNNGPKSRPRNQNIYHHQHQQQRRRQQQQQQRHTRTPSVPSLAAASSSSSVSRPQRPLFHDHSGVTVADNKPRQRHHMHRQANATTAATTPPLARPRPPPPPPPTARTSDAPSPPTQLLRSMSMLESSQCDGDGDDDDAYMDAYDLPASFQEHSAPQWEPARRRPVAIGQSPDPIKHRSASRLNVVHTTNNNGNNATAAARKSSSSPSSSINPNKRPPLSRSVTTQDTSPLAYARVKKRQVSSLMTMEAPPRAPSFASSVSSSGDELMRSGSGVSSQEYPACTPTNGLDLCTPTNAEAQIQAPTVNELNEVLANQRYRDTVMETTDVITNPVFCVGNVFMLPAVDGSSGAIPPEDMTAAKRRMIATTTSRFTREFEPVGTSARGSYGAVIKCRKRFDGCVYAVKKLVRVLGVGKQAVAGMQEVYKLAACTSSPHIVRYYDAWLEEGHLHIQCEWCGRGSLSSQLDFERRPFDERRLCRVALHVASALAYIHRRNFYHMDVKPDNVLEDDDGVYKLCDFGLQNASGDRRYLPWEALQECVTDEHRDRVDVYSLGGCLYHLAVGVAFKKVPTPTPSSLPSLSPPFNTMLQAMLHANPRQRPTAQQLVAHIHANFQQYL